MDYLFEHTAPVWVVGGLLLTMSGIAYGYSRSLASLLSILVALLLIGVGLIVEALIVTEREQVQQSVVDLLDRVEANDLPGVLSMLAPGASQLRADADLLMPQFAVRMADYTGEIEVVVDAAASPPEATADFHFVSDVTHKKSGMRGVYPDDVTLHFRKHGQAWVITDYSTDQNWRRDASRL